MFKSITLNTIFILLLVLPYYAHGFCVYNKMEAEDGSRIYIRQIGGQRGDVFSRFRRDKFYPGEKACCPYTKKQCAKDQTPDSEVSFWVSHAKGDYRDLVGYEINSPAGGYIIFSGTYLSPKFQVFNADHTDYQFRLQHHYRNSFNYAKIPTGLSKQYASIKEDQTSNHAITDNNKKRKKYRK